MIVIGYGYKARQGKDVAVSTILHQRGDKYDVRRYSFAGELKREVNEAAVQAGGMRELIERLRRHDNVPDWVTYEENPDMTDPDCPLGKQRKLLQFWGTNYRRKQDPFYWVTRLRERLLKEQPQVALISDVRFLNELLWIKSPEINGYTVKVVRHGFVDENSVGHESEHQLDGRKFDITITCADGDIEGLRRASLEAFDHIMKLETVELPDFTLAEFERELAEGDGNVCQDVQG